MMPKQNGTSKTTWLVELDCPIVVGVSLIMAKEKLHNKNNWCIMKIIKGTT